MSDDEIKGGPPPRKFGVSKGAFRSLGERIERSDPLEERLGMETHSGSIEEIEERMFPWLKKRRQIERR
jgi:hypothetical protein